MPRMQAFIQVVPPISPRLPPVVILVIGDALLVILGLVPGFCYTWPQAGCHKVAQRGYELLVDQEFFRRCSVIFENLAVKLVS